MDKIKVISSKMMKNKNYEIVLSNDEVLLVKEDIVVNYRLVKDKEIELDLLNEINTEIMYFIAYEKAIKYISNGAKSSYQVKKYLEQKEIDKSIINRIIKNFEENKYIDDESYTKDYVNHLVNEGYGNKLINYKIKQYGIKEEYINNALLEIEKEEYENNAIIIATKQLRNYMKYDNQTRELKLKKYLQSRGYDYDVIYMVVKKVCFNEG